MARALLAVLAAVLLPPLLAAGMLVNGWWNYRRLETSIVGKMDQYYLNISAPNREDYLLEGDEVFEVPYLASKLSVAAVPTRVLDASGRLICEFSGEKTAYVRDPAELPAFLKKALVATEDGTFYRHGGLNYRAMARAMLANLRHLRHVQGGSTITQQLAKLMFTTRKKTYGRKIFEAFCARKLERKFTKDQLLLMYFNYAYFGHGAFGVESAARFYFGKSTRDLDLGESAMLAGIVNSPGRFSPYENPAAAKARQRTVLTRMAKLGYIPASAVERYCDEFWKAGDARFKAPESSMWKMTVNEAPYLTETVRRALGREFSRERITKGGLVVRTTFDLEIQKAAQQALREGLAAFWREDLSTGPRVQGGLAAVEPRSGAVLALVGGAGFNFSNQLNRALDIARPAGSALKPFVYAAAFESGRYRPEDRMLDAPIRYRRGGKVWAPRNYNGKYYGEVTLAEALQRSLNSVAIRLLEAVDIDAVIGLLSGAAGIPRESWPRNLTLALGTADVSPLQLAAAYSVFANGGRPVRPYFIASIEDRDGAALGGAAPAPASETVLSSGTCRAVASVLRGVFGAGGTAHAAALRTGFNVPAAGKTGTTNDYRDAWFAGFTADLSAAVWVGHDDMRAALGQGETGGRFAAPIWMSFIKAVYRNRPTKPLF
ncbi:MAG: PBP1A family penicillin-binding protein [Elusimicrobia bacterium]|nr:PBP1A family penicillin-binding protein [Elusimicrobiota bacterium]